MMTTIAGALLLPALLLGGTDSDTTIVVPAGARLDVQAHGGEIVVDTWARNEVRVQASHGSRDQVRVTTSGQVVRVRTETALGIPAIVEYRITVPVGMDLELGGIHTDVTVTGTRGQVRAQTVQGRIVVNGGTGQVSLESVNGEIVLEGARATVNARAISGAVRLRDVQGDVSAQSVSGAVVLESVVSSNLAASSVSGQVYFDGPIAAGGRYTLASHSGSVIAAVPENLNATVTVAQFSGSFTTTLLALTSASATQGRRRTLTAGTGNATLELESFSGGIRLVRRGEVAPPGR